MGKQEPSQSQAPPAETEKPKRTKGDFIRDFRNKVLERGGSAGMQSLARIFRLMDTDDNRRINPDELQIAMEHYGLYLDAHDANLLFKALDKDKTGSLNVTEFLLAIRGQVNERRQEMIDMAYDVL